MKILVTSSQNQASKEMKSFSEGVKYLKKLGHNISEISNEGKSPKELAKSFSKSDKNVKDTDILIAEITEADSTIGYQIARALDEKKVVIALENDKAKITLPIIHGNDTKQLVYRKYNADNIVDITEDALQEALSKLDSKFILIISPEMDRYLNWASKTKRIHKAQIVRAAVEQMIKKDKEYRQYNEE